jgi:S1-C subfamily serine protease
VPGSAGPDKLKSILRQQERYTLSVALQFSKRNRNSMQRALSLLTGITPNAYASGFVVGDDLVMTSYHVVSGELDPPKKKTLGFKPQEPLEVKAFVNGCEARVVKTDEKADLALLRVCAPSIQAKRPEFETTPSKNEQLFLIAQPGDYKVVRRGVFQGSYTFRGQQYWSIKTDGRDGFSGSPVYNDQGEVVGVFSGYDWNQDLAFMSPGAKAQKFLADYYAAAGSPKK